MTPHRLAGAALLASLLFAVYGIPACGSACKVVVASDFDVSCTVDSDCAPVPQVSSCPAGECDFCNVAAVSQSVLAQYKSAVSDSLSSVSSGSCNCGCEGDFAICRAGKCEVGPCSPDTSDTLPACQAQKGRCGFVKNTICKTALADACAYDDEICCLD